ncbi:MAG: universal stress protein [Puniceicoccaceae bacterium]|nr:MAG: universal stress protein [Puniceicoccaceae bacterium]
MKKLLVCTDGSRYGQVCCEYAAWWAARAGAAVEILYVTDLRQFEVPLVADLSGSLGIQPYQAVLGQLQELENQKASLILDDARGIFERAGFKGALKVTHKLGLLVDTLKGENSDCDLILMGKRGENANFATEHLGSSMERVVRSTAKPCLVTSRSFRDLRKILLAFDGGSSAVKAVRFVAESPVFKDLEIHLVTVAAGEEEDAALKRLREAEKILREAGVEPVVQMLHGVTEDEIARYVTDSAMDMLVMGAYGHSRIRYLIIGSTTAEMLRSCRVPVLLFR